MAYRLLAPAVEAASDVSIRALWARHGAHMTFLGPLAVDALVSHENNLTRAFGPGGLQLWLPSGLALRVKELKDTRKLCQELISRQWLPREFQLQADAHEKHANKCQLLLEHAELVKEFMRKEMGHNIRVGVRLPTHASRRSSAETPLELNGRVIDEVVQGLNAFSSKVNYVLVETPNNEDVVSFTESLLDSLSLTEQLTEVEPLNPEALAKERGVVQALLASAPSIRYALATYLQEKSTEAHTEQSSEPKQMLKHLISSTADFCEHLFDAAYLQLVASRPSLATHLVEYLVDRAHKLEKRPRVTLGLNMSSDPAPEDLSHKIQAITKNLQTRRSRELQAYSKEQQRFRKQYERGVTKAHAHDSRYVPASTWKALVGCVDISAFELPAQRILNNPSCISALDRTINVHYLASQRYLPSQDVRARALPSIEDMEGALTQPGDLSESVEEVLDDFDQELLEDQDEIARESNAELVRLRSTISLPPLDVGDGQPTAEAPTELTASSSAPVLDELLGNSLDAEITDYDNAGKSYSQQIWDQLLSKYLTKKELVRELIQHVALYHPNREAEMATSTVSSIDEAYLLLNKVTINYRHAEKAYLQKLEAELRQQQEALSIRQQALSSELSPPVVPKELPPPVSDALFTACAHREAEQLLARNRTGPLVKQIALMFKSWETIDLSQLQRRYPRLPHLELHLRLLKEPLKMVHPARQTVIEMNPLTSSTA